MQGKKGLAASLATLLVTVVLAGCASDAPGEEDEVDFSGLDLEADAETGIIRGLVVDAAVRPVTGVQVTLTAADGSSDPLMRETDEKGVFGFGALAPGAYVLEAAKLGFLPARQTTVVEAGVADPPIVKVLLEVDPEALPFVQIYKWDGFIECSFALVVVLFAACSNVGNDNFLEEYTFEGMPEYIQSEMVWESTQQLGSSMQLSVTDFRGDTQVRINASAGPSPVVLGIDRALIEQFEIGVNNTPVWRVFAQEAEGTDVVPEDVVHDAYASNLYPILNSTGVAAIVNETVDALPIPVVGSSPPLREECIGWPVLFSSCMGAGGVGATIQQEYTVFTHAFYNFAPPEGWQFSVDGAPEP